MKINYLSSVRDLSLKTCFKDKRIFLMIFNKILNAAMFYTDEWHLPKLSIGLVASGFKTKASSVPR